MRVSPGWLQVEGGWICRCRRHPTKAGERIRYRVQYPDHTYCGDCDTYRAANVSPKKEEVSCTCGCEIAGLPGHSHYCDKSKEK